MTLIIVLMAMAFLIGLALGVILQAKNGPDYNDEE
jgi:uncharacterized protein YneF (UPF0154 family)